MVTRREVEKYFQEKGFVNVGGANHDRLQHPDGRWTILGRHGEIPNQLFEKMKKQAEVK